MINDVLNMQLIMLNAYCKVYETSEDVAKNNDTRFYREAEALAKAGYGRGHMKTGKWLWINEAKSYLEPPYGDTCECSTCGYVIDVSETGFKYCPECGTRMLGVFTGTMRRG